MIGTIDRPQEAALETTHVDIAPDRAGRRRGGEGSRP
jgi:hypothetical protein